MKRIGVFCSGGDAPGMNAAIRAVVKMAAKNGLEVYGIYFGFQGMIEGQIKELTENLVHDIIGRGGSIIKAGRSKGFLTREGRQAAFENLNKHNIQGLIAIGGDGTFKGCKTFIDEFDLPIIGLPGTIDNDLYGTDQTIGYDTAINTAMEAIDKIRDTAHAHNRLFLVEVMGRDAGFIALRSGIGAGADAILVPELETDTEKMIKVIKSVLHKRQNGIIVVSEGDDAGGVYSLAELIKSSVENVDMRITVLGHVQRGGRPTCSDRVLACRLGSAAVHALLEGESGIMLGQIHRSIESTTLDLSLKHHKELKTSLAELVEFMS